MSILVRLLRLIRFPFWMLSFFLKRSLGKVDYLLINIPPDMRAMPTQRSWFQRRLLGEAPLSLYELRQIFDRVAETPRCQGVVLYLRDLKIGIANTQSLRQAILDLKARGKRVVVWANTYNVANYYVATAASEVLIGPWGTFETTGLRFMITYLHDALDAIGAHADVVAITPYKAAGEQLTQQEMSPEFREQVDWVFDELYEQFVAAVGADRDMSREEIETMVARAPLSDAEALEAGYVDAICGEEDLGARLETEHILAHKDGLKLLGRPWRRYQPRKVVVLHVEGLMVEGENFAPPPGPRVPIVGEPRMGNISVIQQIRNIAKDRRAAAVVLHIESNGGSTACAIPIARALEELNKDKPLVICMNNMAASGGYAVSMPARWIVARPGTITGSIGVVLLKVSLGGVYAKLRINPVELARGAGASLESNITPWTEEQIAHLRHLCVQVYNQFLAQVAAGRGMSTEAVDAVGGGRIWLGTQALAHGLIDELGGLPEAIRKARELADLPDDARVEVYQEDGDPLGPQFAATNPAAALYQMHDNLLALNGVQMLMPVRWEWR